MNGQVVIQGVAGWAAEAREIELGEQLRIGELRFSYTAHLQFICGRTLAQLLSNARLHLDDGRMVPLLGLPQLEVPCRMFEVPYRLTRLVFALPTEEKRT